MSWEEYKKKREQNKSNVNTNISNSTSSEISSWEKYKQEREQNKKKSITTTISSSNELPRANTRSSSALSKVQNSNMNSVQKQSALKALENSNSSKSSMLNSSQVLQELEGQNAEMKKVNPTLANIKYTGKSFVKNAGDTIKAMSIQQKAKNAREDEMYGDAFSRLDNTINEVRKKAGKQEIEGVSDLYYKKRDKQLNKIDELYKEISTPVEKPIGITKGGEVAGQISGTIGRMAPSIAMSFIPGAGPALSSTTMGMSVSGEDIGKGLSEGESLKQAKLGGDLKGLASIGIEKLTGGVKIGGAGKLDDIVGNVIAKKATNKVTNFLATKGYQIFGEVAEENIENIAGFAIDKFIDNKDISVFGEAWKDAGETSKMTFLTTVVLNCLGVGGSNQSVYTEVENMTGKKLTAKQTQAIDKVIEETQNEINNQGNNTEETAQLNDILNNKELPMQSYIYENSDNEKINNLRQDANVYFNNTEKAHKYVQMLEQIIQDKNINIRLDGNLKTKDGKVANGSYSNGTITINPNSTKAGEFIAIHELTHAIGTKSMMNIVENYRKSNVEFNSAVENLLQNYNTTELTEEALSDVSAQLFGNQEFINNIANTNPGFFQKIYNEIKYLWHQFRGYKNQNQFVEDLYYKWTQAYNSNNKLNNTTNHSIETNNKGYKYVKADRQVISGNNPLVWEQQVEDYINETIRKGKDVQVFTDDGYILSITEDTAGKAKFRNEVIDKNGNKRRLNNKEFMAKLRAETHIDELGETSIHKQGPVPDTKDHSFAKDGFTYRTAYFEDIDGQYYKITMSVGKNGDINTIYNIGKMQNAQKNRRSSISELKGSSGKTTSDRISSINSIPSSNENVNTTKYSIQENENYSQDNKGRTLTKEQQDFFKNSKVRDENGNLLIMYHGTPNGEFNVFRPGSYFSARKEYASGYENTWASAISSGKTATNPKTYEVYLNITNPFTLQNPEAKNIYLNEFIKGGNSLSYDPYTDWTNDINNLDEIDWTEAEDLREWLQENHPEYDGLILDEGGDGGYGEAEYRWRGKSFVPFNSDQIKNIDNTNPTSNPDIRYSQNNKTWQQHLDKNFKPTGTRTNLHDIALPTAKNNVAPSAGNNVAPSLQNNVAERAKKTMNPAEIANLRVENANTTPKLEKRNYTKGNKQSSFLSNIITDAKFLNEDLRQEMSKEENIRYYQGITNEKTLEKAYTDLKDGGEKETLNWFNKDNKNTSAEDVAKGWILLKQYQDAGDYQSAVEVAKKMRTMATSAGQAVQAYNILSRLTPEGMFYYAQSELNEAYNKMVEGKSKKWIDENASKFDLTPEETQIIMDTMKEVSTMEDGRARTVKLAEIQKLISDKIPPTAGQSMKAWMRISMLFNAKTQVRNVAGNAIIAPVNTGSDIFASAMDRLIAKKTGVRTTGTTKIKNYAKGFGKGLYESYDDFRRGINTRNVEGNRFEVKEGKNFKDKGIGKALNRVDNILSFALDAGDRGFYEATFTNSINNQLVLNNTTEVTQDMIDIATTEALQRTWQDNNAYTQAVLTIRNALNGKIGKHKGMGYGLGDVLIPFAKTPANLTKAIVDYSPIGLVKTLALDARKFTNSLKNGQYSPQLQHRFVQNLGKGMVGSVLYAVAYGLASAGIATGESDKDKDVKNFMKNSLGIGSYSIKIGDKSFSYDWAQPIATPLAIMTNYVKYSKDNPDANALEKGINAINIGTEQLLEQSFMESLNTVLNGSGTTLENLSQAVLELPARAVPTFSKQIADMVDGTQRTTFEYERPGKSAVNSVIAKIPFASKTLPASVDTLGNEIQKYGGKNHILNVMLNPANTNKGQLSKAGEEIYNVYMQTGDTTIFPRTAPYYIKSDGETITITSSERNEFQKTTGKYVENAVNGLLKDKDYNKLSDEKKAEIINEIVTDSYAKAKYDILNIDTEDYEKLRNTLKSVNTTSYYSYKFKTDGMKKDSEKIDVLINANYTNKEKTTLYETYILSSKDEKYPIIKEMFTENGLNITKYLEYKNQEFEADKKDDGTVDEKTISGSKKNKVWNYIDNMNITYTQKLILWGLEYTPSDYQQKQIVTYINALPNKTQKEKLEILSHFKGFTIYKNGKFSY